MGWFRREEADDPGTLRDRMVERQIEARGVTDPVVLEAMREVPRHLFMAGRSLREAYSDHALPIGHDQTISQPYIVASMTEMLEPEPGLRVLEVGTGSGYQAAVLAACGMEVYSVERIPELHRRAREHLREAGYLDRVHLRLGDGSRGWPEHAPYARILLTAAARTLPEPLVEQLEAGGIAVAPVGGPSLQHIYRYRKGPEGEMEREKREGARFVPLVRDEE
jgi:protein-L-isoaspartate(D-aspartate) O-methyltransferase